MELALGIDQIFLLFAAAIATSFAAVVTGMGWGMAMLMLMSLFVPLPLIIPIHGINQFFSNFFVFAYLHQYTHVRTVCYFILGAVPGAVLGYYLLTIITNNEVFLAVLATMTIITAIKPKISPAIKLSPFGYSMLGLVATMIAPLIGAVEPLVAPFFLRSNFKRQTFVSTKACCQMMVHVSKVPVFLANDFPYGLYDVPILTVVFSSYVGTIFGVSVLHKINQKTFTIILRAALLIMGTAMLWRLLM